MNTDKWRYIPMNADKGKKRAIQKGDLEKRWKNIYKIEQLFFSLKIIVVVFKNIMLTIIYWFYRKVNLLKKITFFLPVILENTGNKKKHLCTQIIIELYLFDEEGQTYPST